MGEIADDIIDGVICQWCCGPLPGEPRGFPASCRDCAHNDAPPKQAKPKAEKVSCPKCGARVKKAGLADHTRDVPPDPIKSPYARGGMPVDQGDRE